MASQAYGASKTTGSDSPAEYSEENDWIFARQYHRGLIDKILSRLPLIFVVSLITLLAGVVLTVAGSILVLQKPDPSLSALVFLGTGVLTLLIGAICFQQYRTMVADVRVYISEPLTESEWEAARRKIQYYMHENLMQVRWIFWLTLFAMFLGFVIILCGAGLAVLVPTQHTPTIVVTLSGVLVEFLGATFLFVYKSTMAQAREYIGILERINTVGISVRIMEAIQKEPKLDELRGKIASEILALYGKKREDEA